MKRIQNDRIAKRVHVGECASSRSVGRLQERWIDNVKECLKKIGLDVSQPRRVMHDRNVWWGVSEGKCMGHCLGDEPLMRCYSLMKNLSVVKPITYEDKGENFIFPIFSFTDLERDLSLPLCASDDSPEFVWNNKKNINI